MLAAPAGVANGATAKAVVTTTAASKRPRRFEAGTGTQRPWPLPSPRPQTGPSSSGPRQLRDQRRKTEHPFTTSPCPTRCRTTRSDPADPSKTEQEPCESLSVSSSVSTASCRRPAVRRRTPAAGFATVAGRCSSSTPTSWARSSASSPSGAKRCCRVVVRTRCRRRRGPSGGRPIRRLDQPRPEIRGVGHALRGGPHLEPDDHHPWRRPRQGGVGTAEPAWRRHLRLRQPVAGASVARRPSSWTSSSS